MIGQLINPRTEEFIAEINPFSSTMIEKAIALADSSHREWRLLPLSARLEKVKALAVELGKQAERMAGEIGREMGKGPAEAKAEVEKCRKSCEIIAARLPEWSAPHSYKEGGTYEVYHEPLGVVLGIMPWNFPLWQVIRFAVPAVALGNSVLLKHAPNVWGVAKLIGEAFERAGFPQGVYQDFPIDVESVAKVIADPRVRAASLTGSRRAGIGLMSECAKHLKKVVLELGGSDAYVVLADADIDLAAAICAKSRLQNAGQSCVSAKRFIVHRSVAKEFTEKFGSKLQEMGAEVAPLARKDLRDLLHDQVERSIKAGARLEFGGRIPSGKGFFYPVTLLTNVKPGMAAFDEELFGPVGAVIVGESEDELFELANKSIYGLGGAVFSKNVERAYELARTKMEAGMVFVNDFVRSHAEVPFGGVKDSGLGRELGREGSLEFCNVKLLFKP